MPGRKVLRSIMPVPEWFYARQILQRFLAALAGVTRRHGVEVSHWRACVPR
jgi:hypothetical protein